MTTLLNADAKVDLTDRAGRTALHRVAANNAKENSSHVTAEQCVVALLGGGASLSKCDKAGKTPRALARELGLKSVDRVMQAAAKVHQLQATMKPGASS